MSKKVCDLVIVIVVIVAVVIVTVVNVTVVIVTVVIVTVVIVTAHSGILCVSAMLSRFETLSCLPAC